MAERTCRECNDELSSTDPPWKVFCSRQCKDRWHYQRRNRSLAKRREQDRARKVVAGTAVGSWMVVRCLECRKEFQYELGVGRPPRLCSVACKQRRRRGQELEQRYGISLPEYERRFEQQQGRCGICAGPLITRSQDRFAAVDHDHLSSAVRGLLCHRCNLALGQFGDDIEILRSAIRYLEQGGT